MCRAEKVCWTLVVLGAAAMVAPFVFEESHEPLGDARWAGVMTGAMVAPTAAICSFLFRARGRVRDRLLRDEGLLARWTCSPGEWRSYLGEDIERERGDKWRLYAIVAFWCVLFGVLFPIFDHDAGWWVTAIMAGLLAFIALLIVVSTAARKRRLARHAGDIRVREDGLWLSGELHVWRGFGARLEGVELIEGTPPCLAFTYSMPAKNQRQRQTVRVPVAQGSEAQAADVAAHFFAVLAAKK